MRDMTDLSDAASDGVTDGKAVLVSIEKPIPAAQSSSRPQGRGDFDLMWVSVADSASKVIKSLEWWRSNSPALNSIDARLSPDGKFIAYSAKAAQGSPGSYIYIISADGATETIATKTAGINEAPIWAPDGSQLLFISDRSGSSSLWSLSQLAQFAIRAYGARIAFRAWT